jgi:hypothetical protein
VALALAAALVTACVPNGPYGPTVYNALPSQVFIELGLDDGGFHRSPFPAGQLAYVGNPPSEVRSVTVKDRLDGVVLYAWSEEELRLVAGKRRVDRSSIVIGPDGLRLVSMGEAEELKRAAEE